eukprot:SAG11_NODE_7_length_31267_cov_19.541966_20_plen_82_part_00
MWAATSLLARDLCRGPSSLARRSLDFCTLADRSHPTPSNAKRVTRGQNGGDRGGAGFFVDQLHNDAGRCAELYDWMRNDAP